MSTAIVGLWDIGCHARPLSLLRDSYKISAPSSFQFKHSSTASQRPIGSASANSCRNSYRTVTPCCAESSRDSDTCRSLLIDNYDSYTFNLFQLLAVVNGEEPVVIRNDEYSWSELEPLLFSSEDGRCLFDNIVISPGPGTPAEPSDVGVCAQVMAHCTHVPILGVCMGHQLLGYVHGAQIEKAPQPVHGRLSWIQHSNHPLFSNMPPRFQVVRYHSLAVKQSSLPSSLSAIAWTEAGSDACSVPLCMPSLAMADYSSDSHPHLPAAWGDDSTVLMAMAHADRPHYGVQFHPESVATSHGAQLLLNFKALTLQHWQKHPWLARCRAAGMADQRALLSSMLPMPQTAHSAPGEDLVLSWRCLPGILDEVGGSESLFCALYGSMDAEDTFWLDSASTAENRARFSFMGGPGGHMWRKLVYRMDQGTGHGRSGQLSIQDSEGHLTVLYGISIWDYLDQQLSSWRCQHQQSSQLPFHFCGGFVGYLGYELKAECGARPSSHLSPTPDAAFFLVDQFIAVDHLKGDVYVLSLNPQPQGCPSSSSWLDATAALLLQLAVEPSSQMAAPLRRLAAMLPPGGRATSFLPEKGLAEYALDVDRCLQLIGEGQSYELCLTSQLASEWEAGDPLGAYLVLRRENPAPYGAWLSFNLQQEGSLHICCSSPERFLRCDPQGNLQARPIKGTVPRGASPLEDSALKAFLLTNEKDRAENLMIVDLLRNDLGRVCQVGSVEVPAGGLMAVESFSSVHQLVSTVIGRKRAGVSSLACVRAAFPGGSMTGAPKVRSMELLDGIEGRARGVYSGSVGYFSFCGAFDLNIVIRTAVMFGGWTRIGAGGAIVAMSDRESEFAEMMLKARSLVRVFESCRCRGAELDAAQEEAVGGVQQS